MSGGNVLSYLKEVTIREVAKYAGVSIATVSRYLNSTGYIDKETAQKVRVAVDALGYRPNRIAQGLKTRRSRQIIMIVPDICNPFYSNMYKSVQEFVHDKGYSAILYNTNEKIEEELTAVKMIKDINADGVLFCSVNTYENVLHELASTGKPVTVINSYEKCLFDTVHSLRCSGVYMTARYLIESGHKNIAYAGGLKESAINQSRKQGFAKALLEDCIPVKEDYCFEMGFSMDAGYKAGRYFSTLKPLPDAICAANDLIAMGIIQAFGECGIRIPEDVSLTGMDNIEYTELSRPGLTTVTNNPVEYGKTASRLMFDRIEGRYDGGPREVDIQRELIIRNSVRML
jgi:DNA-binding LacI/PurR family transcriptional regulator